MPSDEIVKVGEKSEENGSVLLKEDSFDPIGLPIV